ncbi:MAG: hypothetical protein RR768_05670 [Clostridium sp.]
MQKIGSLYILTASEMDEIQYNLDLYYKYKAMSEIDWTEQAENEEIAESTV